MRVESAGLEMLLSEDEQGCILSSGEKIDTNGMFIEIDHYSRVHISSKPFHIPTTAESISHMPVIYQKASMTRSSSPSQSKQPFHAPLPQPKLNAIQAAAHHPDPHTHPAVHSSPAAAAEVGTVDPGNRPVPGFRLGVRHHTTFISIHPSHKFPITTSYLIMLVVIVVPRTTVISLRRPTIASLLSVSAWRRTAVALLAALSAEAGLRAVARVLLLAVGCAVTSLLRSAVLSLAGCGRGVAAVAWLLAAGVVGRWGRGAGIGAAGCGGGVVAVAVVAAAGGLVVLHVVSVFISTAKDEGRTDPPPMTPPSSPPRPLPDEPWPELLPCCPDEPWLCFPPPSSEPAN